MRELLYGRWRGRSNRLTSRLDVAWALACGFWCFLGLILFSLEESRPGKANDDEGCKTRAFGGAGVSPAVLRSFSTMQTRRRDAGATKNGGISREIASFIWAEVLVRYADLPPQARVYATEAEIG